MILLKGLVYHVDREAPEKRFKFWGKLVDLDYTKKKIAPR